MGLSAVDWAEMSMVARIKLRIKVFVYCINHQPFMRVKYFISRKLKS